MKGVVSKIIRQAIGELYKTRFRLLKNFGRKNYNQTLRKVKRVAAKLKRRKKIKYRICSNFLQEISVQDKNR